MRLVTPFQAVGTGGCVAGFCVRIHWVAENSCGGAMTDLGDMLLLLSLMYSVEIMKKLREIKKNQFLI